MGHGLDSCVTVLRRWASHSDQPLPQDWNAFKAKNIGDAARILSIDPELVSLLDGTAKGSLRADAICGKWSAVGPTAEEVAQKQKQQRIQQLHDSKPYQDGRMVNMAAALELDELAPEVGARLRKEANYMHPHEREAKAAADRQAQENWMRQQSAQAQLKRLQDHAAGRF